MRNVQELLLFCGVMLFAAAGYWLMKRIDIFLEENQKRREDSEEV